jgi:hypothetical protein
MQSILEQEATFDLEAQAQEQRQSLRQIARRTAVRIEHATLGWQEGVIKDMSRKGMRFRTTFFFPCGSEITVHPPADSGLPTLSGRIMRQIIVPGRQDDLFEYGVHLSDGSLPDGHRWYLKLCYPEPLNGAAAASPPVS